MPNVWLDDWWFRQYMYNISSHFRPNKKYWHKNVIYTSVVWKICYKYVRMWKQFNHFVYNVTEPDLTFKHISKLIWFWWMNKWKLFTKWGTVGVRLINILCVITSLKKKKLSVKVSCISIYEMLKCFHRTVEVKN